MTLQDLGAIGELVGGLAVVLSLVYIAFQVRQNSRQIDQNSRQLEASTYYASGEAFSRWWSYVIQDERLADLWNRGLAGEMLDSTDTLRFHGMASVLFTAWENNFHQEQIGSHHRGTLEIGRPVLTRLLASPGIRVWWAREARRLLTPEFVRDVESRISIEQTADPGENAA